MVKISERLRTAAGLIGEGERLADVGTDHGYVPIYLVERKRIPSAIAMDIRTGPLERAREHIRMYGMEDYIQTRLSDGVAALKPGEADTILIAGMGGGLVIHILEAGRSLWETIGYWVLSPQSELDKVRRFLEKESFSIVRETMMKEDGKYYTVMGVTRGGLSGENDSEPHYLYGSRLIRQKNPVLAEFLKKEQEQLEQILDTLKDSDTPAALKRRVEMMEKLAWNKEAQDEMLGTDTEA